MKNNYKINYFFIFFFILQCSPLLIHGQVTTFQKIYPASINQIGKDVLPTLDGGYLMVGTTETSIFDDLDISISKTDNLGVLLWTKTYGGNRPDYPNCILEINNGNYFVIGGSQSFGGGDLDMYLLKINSSGDTLWGKAYGGFGNEDGKEIIATADGNYVIVGASNSINFTDNNMELLKIDPSGNILWTKYYGGPDYESARSVKLCLDGGFIIAGKTGLSNTSVTSMYMVKTNSLGDILWTKTYTGPNSYEGKFIVANSDGSYTLCVDDSSGTRDSDVRVMNISSTGIINWDNSYGGTDKDICKMIQPTSDGGYIISAISRSFGWTNPDIWLLKINTSGDLLWTRNYGGGGHEHSYAARETADGGFIVVGQTRSYSVNIQMMLIKLNSIGTLTPVNISEIVSNDINFNIYPNPSDGVINIDLRDAIYSQSTFRISNSLGQIVVEEVVDQSSGTENKVIDLKDEKPGVYFVSVLSHDHIITKKLVLN